MSKEKTERYIIVVCMVVVACSRLLVAEMQIDWDEELYFQIANHWSASTLPYRDLFDHKAPLLYLYIWLLSAGGHSFALYRIISGLVLGLSALALVAALRRSFAPPERKPACSESSPVAGAASISWLFAPLLYALLSRGETLGANSEILYIPLLIFALIFALRGWVIAAASAAALAINIKYTVFLDLIGVLLFYRALGGCRRTQWRLVLGTAALGLGIFAALYIYFRLHGVDVIEETVLRNLRHASHRRAFALPGRFLVGCAACLVFGLAMRGRRSGAWATGFALRWPLVIWLVLSLFQATITGKYYFHYFIPAFIPLALISCLRPMPDTDAISAAAQPRRLLPQIRFVVAIATVFVLSATVAYNAVRQVLSFDCFKQQLEDVCSLRRFHYHGRMIAAYRVCDVKPQRFLFPPFYAQKEFIDVAGSSGSRWFCELSLPVVVEERKMPFRFQIYDSGAQACASGVLRRSK